MPSLPLGGTGADFDSKKSRGLLVNLFAEANQDKSYRTIKRCDGLTNISTAFGPMRSNILTNGSFAYFISGVNLYRVNSSWVSTSLGSVGGIGQGLILSNSVPGNNQILVLNGSGDGYIYDNSGLTKITDPDFFPTVSGTVLDERFWFIREGTNEFFASDISDGFSYNPLSFASAEESPDPCKAIIAIKSSLWVIGSGTSEFWQSFNDSTLPVRKVRSSTIPRGIKAVSSLAEIDDRYAFLADDLTIKLVSGETDQTISDLHFNLKIRGNGTPTSPGFTTTEDAIGFFVDSPTHKIYYITFPTEGYTWGYDLSTGLTHTRASEDVGYWRAIHSAKFNGKIIMGDNLLSTVWVLDPASKKEGDNILRTVLRIPGISFKTDVTIAKIEIDMEVGETEDPTISPFMMVRYSKDGGNKWWNHSDVALGDIGDRETRVVIREFGRLVRYRDFILEMQVTEPVRVQFYGADMPMGQYI